MSHEFRQALYKLPWKLQQCGKKYVFCCSVRAMTTGQWTGLSGAKGTGANGGGPAQPPPHAPGTTPERAHATPHALVWPRGLRGH